MTCSANILTTPTISSLSHAHGAVIIFRLMKCIPTVTTTTAGGVMKISSVKGTMSKMTIKLKPCPFCGYSEFLPTPPSKYSRFGFVGCKICGTDGPNRLTLDEAKEAWNERAYEKDENDD